MFYYTIDKADLGSRIDEEVSNVADEAYSDNGASLYDSIILTEKDSEEVDRFIDTAVSSFVTRAFDICKYYYQTESSSLQTNEKLEFYVPDLDETMEPAIIEEISKYITLFVCTCVFQTRRPSVVPQYTERTQAAMNRAIALLKSRKSPIELW